MQTKEKRKRLIEALEGLPENFIAHNIFISKVGTKYVYLRDLYNCAIITKINIDGFYDLQIEEDGSSIDYDCESYQYATIYPRLQRALRGN